MSESRGETDGTMPEDQDERDALIVSYALGSATDAEAARARQIIADDPDAARLYAEIAAIAAVLPEVYAEADAVPARPSAALKDRVMAAARAEMRDESAAERAPSSLAAERARRRLPPAAGWLVAAVLLIAVVGLGVWDITLQHDVRQARTDRDVLRFAAAGIHAYTMAGTRNAPTANATLIESAADGGKVVFLAKGFPGVAPGQTYRVWLQKQDGSYVDAGAFRGGDDQTTLVLPGNLNGIHAVVITAEPEQKTTAMPTGIPVMEGALTA